MAFPELTKAQQAVIQPWLADVNYLGGGNSIVSYAGRYWISVDDSIGNIPGDNADYWSEAFIGILSPEALGIPKTNPLAPDIALEPEIRTANSATALEIYNQLTEQRCNRIYIQNLSTTAVKFAWNMAAGESAFHGVLAACAAQDDGLGGFVTLEVKERGIKSLSLFCGASAIRASVQKFVKEGSPVVGYI